MVGGEANTSGKIRQLGLRVAEKRAWKRNQAKWEELQRTHVRICCKIHCGDGEICHEIRDKTLRCWWRLIRLLLVLLVVVVKWVSVHRVGRSLIHHRTASS